jgi:hypothetical protein
MEQPSSDKNLEINSAETKSTLKQQNSQRMLEHCQRKAITKSKFTKLLLDIYEVEDLQPLFDGLKQQYRQGFNAKQLMQLRILHTLISTMLGDQ